MHTGKYAYMHVVVSPPVHPLDLFCCRGATGPRFAFQVESVPGLVLFAVEDQEPCTRDQGPGTREQGPGPDADSATTSTTTTTTTTTTTIPPGGGDGNAPYDDDDDDGDDDAIVFSFST